MNSQVEEVGEENELGLSEEVTEKLTDWENEPSVSDLKQDFEDAKPAHQDHVSSVEAWLDNLNITGSAKLATSKNRSTIQPMLIRKQAEWRYAALTEAFLSTPDMFNVSPVSWEDKKSAQQNELVINNQFNTKIQKVKFVDDYIRTAVDEGTVVVKVGWDYEDEIVEVEVPVIENRIVNDPQALQEQQQIHQMMQQDPQSFQQLPTEVQQIHAQFMQTGVLQVPTQVGTKIEEQTQVVKNQPTLEVCDFNNVTIDPTAEGDMDKAAFVIYSFETSLSELKKDKRYKNLNNIVGQGSSILSEPDHNTQDESYFDFKDKPRKKLVAYEYWGFWDIDNSGITTPIIATYIGDTMVRLEENPFPDKKLPFIVAQYLPVRKSIYGEPDGALLEDNQKIIGAVTRGMIDIMGRSANGQIGSRKDALDITNKRKFDRGEDYEYNQGVTPNDVFFAHTFPEIPQSAQFMLNAQNAEAESLTGVKAFHSGISGQALGETATGIRSALDATSKRELGILRRLAEGVIQIGRKIVGMNALFLEEGEVVRVTNEEFVEVRRDDLVGNFDLRLAISTAEADNEKAKELAFMLQTMGNNMDPSMSQMILSDIARLRKMPELSKKIAEYQPQPNPLAEKKAQLEVALLEAQVFNEQAKGKENSVDVGLKQAKTQTELAKSRNLDSKSDKEDLDFLEQESGIPHQRDMEKADHKTRSDISLKEVDRLLNPKPSGDS